MSSRVEVRRWGRTIGAVQLHDGTGVLQYEPAFARSGIEVSPLVLPLSRAPQSFPGLPGLLADSLPDRYGNALIDAWLAR